MVYGLGLALVFLAFRVARLAAGWRRGRPDAPRVALRDVLSLPRRYLVDVHGVVVRRPDAARMHVLVAGGLLSALVLIVLRSLLNGGVVLNALLVAALLAAAVGAVLALLRTWSRPIRDAHVTLWALLTFALTGVGLVLGQWVATWPALLLAFLLLLNAAALFLVVGLAADGPLRHAIAGGIHLIAHERPERFAGAASSVNRVALPAVDLQAPRLGAAARADFSWKQLAAFDSCVQCRRCEEVCPALAAETPLNPRQLILGLASSGSAGVTPEAIWACTTCRACVEACPMMIEHVDAVVDVRRHLTLAKGETYGKGAETLEAFALTGNSSGRNPTLRASWAAPLNVPRLADKGSARVVLWLGEAAFDARGQRTLKSMIDLMRQADEDFAVLGDEEWDVGDTARRLGDEALFLECVRRITQTLSRYSFERIVTLDPHVFNSLKNDYARLGHELAVEHHTQYLTRLLREGRIKLTPREQDVETRVTLHDPCYLGRYNREYDAPRELLAAVGVGVTEMARSKLRSRCCGAGGGAAITDVPGKHRIADQRMADVLETKATVVAVACPNCAVMLEGVAGGAQVRDVVEIVHSAVMTAHE